MTLTITTTFSVMFAIKSILTVVAASTRTTVPILVFALLEIFPSIVLLYYVMPPASIICRQGEFLSSLIKTPKAMSATKTSVRKTGSGIVPSTTSATETLKHSSIGNVGRDTIGSSVKEDSKEMSSVEDEETKAVPSSNSVSGSDSDSNSNSSGSS
jgi:hypothetical protein